MKIRLICKRWAKAYLFNFRLIAILVPILLPLITILSACEWQGYKPGIVEDDNYYNAMADFKLEKPESMSYVETSDISVQEVDPELYSRAVEMGAADSLLLEYMLSDGKVSLYIYSEKNVGDYLIVPFVDIIKASIEENTDLEVVSITDLHQEVPFRCLVARNDTYEKQYFVTYSGDYLLYIVLTGEIEALEQLSDQDDPMNYISTYYE